MVLCGEGEGLALFEDHLVWFVVDIVCFVDGEVGVARVGEEEDLFALGEGDVGVDLEGGGVFDFDEATGTTPHGKYYKQRGVVEGGV